MTLVVSTRFSSEAVLAGEGGFACADGDASAEGLGLIAGEAGDVISVGASERWSDRKRTQCLAVGRHLSGGQSG